MSKLKCFLAMGLIFFLMATPFVFQDFALADEPTRGAQVFEIHCAGCHVNGGNIVRRGKTLQLKALEKNQVASLEAIVQLVTNGKGIMSAYRERLTEDEIQSVAAYVLEQAKTGWR